MPENWWRELWVVAVLVLGGSLLGAAAGHPFLGLATGLGIYLYLHLSNLYRLQRWVTRRGDTEVPEAEGVWGEVFDALRKGEREAARRKDRLTGMLERFQEASAAVPDAMVILSQDDEIEWANRAAERLLGIHWPRDHKLRIVNLLRSPDFTAYLETGEFQEALQIASPAVPDYTISVLIVPYGSSQKLLIGRDITQLMRLEEMRRNFVANVSHELRTPVTVLLGFVETLKDLTNLHPNELRKYLQTMYEQAVRMQRLVDDLLTLSKLETSPPRRHEEIVDVPAMLLSLKELGEILSGENRHQISLSAEGGLKLRGNQEELRSAFSNLINNAVRYTPAHGAIHLSWKLDTDGVRFSVEDTGEGIAPQHIAHLTERFYRVDTARSRNTGGTGLGLSIVKHVLLRHEARLLIESRLGKGSTFTCLFPTSRAVSSRTAEITSLDAYRAQPPR